MINRFCKDLSNTEIVIVLISIGLLFFVFYFRYDNFKCRSIQSEAKFSLKEIYATQMLYRSEKGHFAEFLELSNNTKRIILPENYYYFEDEIKPDTNSFSILAIGKKGTMVSGEIWAINEKNILVNKNKICQSRK